ncbi:TetR/AcrR family transcriptional regulator [Phreatobacter stygius]|uniref:TetR/AcrR family transcriptional regulator n=1 Tax=Phreatobacter stygius TaxID=1940610 RepID=A0A4D7B873_9HYPH|nr:TetR/AcrR family transcriptional regulator [Phreatobacter stygius]QCI66630.1 TetR/AcrR family transcriptional regulator [Phreatobacter stygius]
MRPGPTPRLSADDWINAGLKALARAGSGALKADLLATELGVSRGSFYWHFADIGAFHQAVLARWRDIAALAIIDDIERSVAREDRLAVLLRRAFAGDTSLEVAVRAWGTATPLVRQTLDAVDRDRVGYIETLLVDLGFKADIAHWRALIFYSTYLGLALSGRRLGRDEIESFVRELSILSVPA